MRMYAAENGYKINEIWGQGLVLLDETYRLSLGKGSAAVAAAERIRRAVPYGQQAARGKIKVGSQLDGKSVELLRRLGVEMGRPLWMVLAIGVSLLLKDGKGEQGVSAFLTRARALLLDRVDSTGLFGKELEKNVKRITEIPEGDPIFLHWSLIAAGILARPEQKNPKPQSETSGWVMLWVLSQERHAYTTVGQVEKLGDWIKQELAGSKMDADEIHKAIGEVMQHLLDSRLIVHSPTSEQLRAAAKVGAEEGIPFGIALDSVIALENYERLNVAIANDDWAGTKFALFYPRKEGVGRGAGVKLPQIGSEEGSLGI